MEIVEGLVMALTRCADRYWSHAIWETRLETLTHTRLMSLALPKSLSPRLLGSPNWISHIQEVGRQFQLIPTCQVSGLKSGCLRPTKQPTHQLQNGCFENQRNHVTNRFTGFLIQRHNKKAVFLYISVNLWHSSSYVTAFLPTYSA